MADKTQVLKIDPKIISQDKQECIVRVLAKGGVIVYPTETFYGLGANCFDRKAVRKIYRLKHRTLSKPLPLVISDLEMLKQVVSEVPPVFQRLASAFWPGPLTLIMKAAPRVLKEIKGTSGSVGVRLTDHSWLRDLIRLIGFPLTATSANISGQAEISDPRKAIEVFEGKVDLIVDGGHTLGVLPSTVLDLTPDSPQILREGAVSVRDINKSLG